MVKDKYQAFQSEKIRLFTPRFSWENGKEFSSSRVIDLRIFPEGESMTFNYYMDLRNTDFVEK